MDLKGQDRLFEKNCALFAKSCPKAALMLPYADEGGIEPCKTFHGEDNLYSSIHGFHYQSQEGAEEEAKGWFSGLKLSQVKLLCIYGIGLAYYYESIKPWLKQNKSRYVVFLEDDLSLLAHLFKQKQASKLLSDPQVQIVYFSDLQDDVFDTLYWNFAQCPLFITALHSYARHKKELFAELSHKIAYEAAMRNALVHEYLQWGAGFYLNFYQNLLTLADSYLGNSLFGQFHGVPAIICGAGPSLAKQLPLLQVLKDNALIFAGGSSLNALNAAGIQPHFGAGIDPNAMQFVRLSTNQAYEVPFFYRQRLYHKAYLMIHGPRLYITGAGGYDTVDYFDEQLGLSAEFFDEGHNVVNFCLQIAHAMGCDPILFVGMDLAFTGLKAYAPGVVEDAGLSLPEILEGEGDEESPLLRQDIYGAPIYTLWKWIAESQWIGNFALDHTTVRLFNCTEGGLGFPHVANVDLKSTAQRYLQRQYPLQARVHGQVQASRLPKKVTSARILKLMKGFKDSVARCIDHLNCLCQETMEESDKIKRGEEVPHSSYKAALAETELVDEIAYSHLLQAFNEVYTRLLSRETHLIAVRRYSAKQRCLKTNALKMKKYQFLKETAQVNAELIDYALRERKKDKADLERSRLPLDPKNDGQAPLTALKDAVYSFDPPFLVMKDAEMGLDISQKFNPKLIPAELKSGLDMGEGHSLQLIYDKELRLSECYIECGLKLDGQCRLYYPDGSVKQECYYKEGRLHGPVAFFSNAGIEVASCWYLDGSLQGKALWHYQDGALYSVQRYRDNSWHGVQQFFHPDGTLKTLLRYESGKLVQADLAPQGAHANA